MHFLVLSIFSSAMISIVMRLSQGKIQARTSLLAVNYLTCTISALFFTSAQAFRAAGSAAAVTTGLGALNGFVYVASLMLTQFNVRKNGVVLQSVFSKIGDLMVPLLFAILVFGEKPSGIQVLGAVLAAAAILTMNLTRQKGSAGSMAALLALFAADGMAGAMSKIYEQTGPESLGSHFLLFTFGTALLLCVGIAAMRKERPGWWELLFGTLIGVPNYFSSRFLLQALNQIPAVVAYPIRSVGSIVVVSLTGLLLFRERLIWKQWLAIGVILVSVALLSI